MQRSEHDAMPEVALDWVQSGQGAALATVVQTWGSAPRPVGSQLVISGEGQIMGSVSGGCVEGAVIMEAMDAIVDGQSRLLTFGVSDDEAFAVGLACGGVIRVMVEPVGQGIPVEMLQDLVARRAERTAVAYVVNTETWDRRLADASDAALGDEIGTRLRSDKSGFAEDETTFMGLHNPPLRMVVVGAVHIAQPLSDMARLCGYDVTIVDPRGAFATPERFPNDTILIDYPDEVLPEYGVDARTAVVTLAHDPKIDDPAIVEALRGNAMYLGCLGSTRTHAKRVDRLTAAGVSEADIARIHAPVGLNIGSKSPAEIAVAIMAQITATLRQG